MSVGGFATDSMFWNAEMVITRGFNPPQVDPSTGKEIMDVVYEGKCSYQYGGNGSVGMQGYSIQEAPDCYIPVVDVPINVNDRVTITKGWETLSYTQLEKASPNYRRGITEIFLNHATRQ